MTRFHSHPITRRVRSIAFLLMLSYLLPFAQMAYAASSDPEAALPACCRTHGKHKCSMRMPLQVQGDDEKHATVSPVQISEKCPCVPSSPTASDTLHFGLPPIGSVRFIDRSESLSFGAWSSPRARLANPAHPKRGPPAFSPFA
jgi:hypothetical protein